MKKRRLIYERIIFRYFQGRNYRINYVKLFKRRTLGAKTSVSLARDPLLKTFSSQRMEDNLPHYILQIWKLLGLFRWKLWYIQELTFM